MVWSSHWKILPLIVEYKASQLRRDGAAEVFETINDATESLMQKLFQYDLKNGFYLFLNNFLWQILFIGNVLALHLTSSLADFVQQNDIYFVRLPANSANLKQLLDVAIFWKM